jgi:hypothetical protein
MNDRLDSLASDWTRIGAGFNAPLAPQTPDLERLLLDTARYSPYMARLFIMAATWLRHYGDLVAKHRLQRLIQDELAPEHQPVLGLLLDIAQQGTHPPEFQAIVKHLPPADPEGTLFEIERSHPILIQRARDRTADIFGKWGFWGEAFEFKDDALRPARWVMLHNPSFITRADFRGDLRASVLAALRHDRLSHESEMALARCAGGSRAQVRAALDNLELTGRVTRVRAPGAKRTTINLVSAA